MVDSKYEYYHKEQVYQKDITPFWEKLNGMIYSLQEEFLYFNINPQNWKDDENRFYVSSLSSLYTIIREISLPNITYLTIYKLKNIASWTIIFYFYLFLDYTYNSQNHPQLIDKIEKRLEKKLEWKDVSKKEKLKIAQIVKSRIWQWDYRIRLLQDMNCCIVTWVNDERLLIASHIKPRAIAEDNEKIDYLNWLILTPTYDKLFDQWFITFTDNWEMLVSPYVSPMNQKKLNLINWKKFNLNSKWRELYLQYHRDKIYKWGNLN